MAIKMNFKDCIIAKDGGFDFNNHRFHTFAEFATYVELHGGRIWYKSGNIIRVKWDEE